MKIRCKTISNPLYGGAPSFDPGVHASIPQVTMKIEALRREGCALAASIEALQSSSCVLSASEAQALLERHAICFLSPEVLTVSDPKGIAFEWLVKKKNELAIVHDVLCRRLQLLSALPSIGNAETHLLALSQERELDREAQRNIMQFLYEIWRMNCFVSLPREILFRAMVAVRMERDALAESLESKKTLLENDIVDYFSLEEVVQEKTFSSLENCVRERLAFVTDYLEKLREDYLRVFEGRILSHREQYVDILDELPSEARSACARAGNLEDFLPRICREELSSALLEEIAQEIPSLSLDVHALTLKELLSTVQHELALAKEIVEEYLAEYEKREYLHQIERLSREELEGKRGILQDKLNKNLEKALHERQSLQELLAYERWIRRERLQRLTPQEEQLEAEEKTLRKNQIRVASQYSEGVPASLVEEQRIMLLVHKERKEHIARLKREELLTKKSKVQHSDLPEGIDMSKQLEERLRETQSSLELRHATLAKLQMQKRVLFSMLGLE